MLYKLIITEQYRKRIIKFLKNHRDLLNRYEKTLLLLEKNPFHPSLRLHKIQVGKNEIYSVSMNMKYRITLEFYIEDKKIIPINIGTHDVVY